MKYPYQITNKILNLYGEINQTLGVATSLLLIKPKAQLRKTNRVASIHSSLAIEGNSLEIKQVSALVDKQNVIAKAKDIIEVENAIKAYEAIGEFDSTNIDHFLKAHKLLTINLTKSSGKFRSFQVGVSKQGNISHIAPHWQLVNSLMSNLFSYIKNDDDHKIIKSCVFHYKVEFIHPFTDGNGRMGRYWQTRLLMDVNPIFEFVPIEKIIKERQQEYYEVLAECDNQGSSTKFIEFMLDAINIALKETVNNSLPSTSSYKRRVEYALAILNGWFDRKDYLNVCKGISTATASRDLKQLLDEKRIISKGSLRMTKYKKRQQ